MANVKQGTRFNLPVEFGVDLDDVTQIEFLFKQGCIEEPTIKSATWVRGNETEDAVRRTGTNIILIAWTEEETYLVSTDAKFSMDTRVTMNDGTMPITPIIEMRMLPTLFEEEEVT